jgi:hypothetical protein
MRNLPDCSSFLVDRLDLSILLNPNKLRAFLVVLSHASVSPRIGLTLLSIPRLFVFEIRFAIDEA